MAPFPDEVTAILTQLSAGDKDASARLLPIVYDELRALAGHLFKAQPANHTLQPTALVHEAYLKLAGATRPPADRAHFMAIAARAMRQILTDHARRRRAGKRGGPDWRRITLDRAVDQAESNTVDLIALEEALARLAERSDFQARIVELRVFGGLTIEEVAQVLEIGRTTAKGEWTVAKIWLKRELLDPADP